MKKRIDEDVDNIDEEEIWESICVIVAGMSGVSAERATAILDAAGFHAFGHTGILDALKVVRRSVNLSEL
jgi:hypothetical protein